MTDFHYVWLAWSLAFLALFWLIYAAYPQHRAMMLLTAIGTAPFGLSEPLFVPEYWNPPSLFNFAEKTGFDIESIIFSFSIGGIGAIIYNLATGRVTRRSGIKGRHRYHWLAVVTPALVFLPLLATGWNPIYPAMIAMAAGALAAVLCRPDLLPKVIGGGFLFMGLYALFMASLRLGAPGFIEAVWNLPALSGWFFFGIPVEELLFGFAFGLFWSGVFEHLGWARPEESSVESRGDDRALAERREAK